MKPTLGIRLRLGVLYWGWDFTAPDQAATAFICNLAMGKEQRVFQCLEALIIELKLELERLVRYTASAV